MNLSRRGFLQFLAATPAIAAATRVEALGLAAKLPESDFLPPYAPGEADYVVGVRTDAYPYYLDIGAVSVGIDSVVLERVQNWIAGVQLGDHTVRRYPGMQSDFLRASTSDINVHFLYDQFLSGRPQDCTMRMATPELARSWTRVRFKGLFTDFTTRFDTVPAYSFRAHCLELQEMP